MDEAGARGPPSAQQDPATGNAAATPKVQQPKPQALPSRSGPSAILVSPRQKGNPILNGVRSTAWEYSDIPADYVLGATTCALFLSLKYHRLHPEYIYNRIRDLKGQYNLRILLTMVDIDNHEESLRELSKTSLINNVTIMLCWSAQEAGRYLELFKTFEHIAPTSIRAQQSTSYSDKLVEFITVPRSINKTDAIGLVSNFGSIRTAVNASPEEIGLIAGWGEKKVQRWCSAVREPFRVQKAARRRAVGDNTRATLSRDISRAEAEDFSHRDPSIKALDADRRVAQRVAEESSAWQPGQDEEAVVREAEQRIVDDRGSKAAGGQQTHKKTGEAELSDGVMAALNKLRQQ
jgi:DNA excision repair protein ERCC-1